MVEQTKIDLAVIGLNAIFSGLYFCVASVIAACDNSKRYKSARPKRNGVAPFLF